MVMTNIRILSRFHCFGYDCTICN